MMMADLKEVVKQTHNGETKGSAFLLSSPTNCHGLRPENTLDAGKNAALNAMGVPSTAPVPLKIRIPFFIAVIKPGTAPNGA